MATTRGSCLCGDVRWEVDAPDFMTHCHCSRCRKAHGAAFATGVMAPADTFRSTRGRDSIERYFSSPEVARPFCRRCGSPVPDGQPFQGMVVIPAGGFDDDPGVRPIAHMFVADKAPWVELPDDGLPRFDAYPPGIDSPVLDDLPDRRAAGKAIGGSCLCGEVAYAIEGDLLLSWNCHCSRCRKARGAAHASNLFAAIAAVRFLRGEDLLSSYKVPEALRFKHVFCRRCGSSMPNLSPERGFAVIPMGTLDDDPGMRPQGHIYVGSRAPWYEVPPGLPQYDEGPPSR